MQSKFKVKWIDFVRPEVWNCYYGFNPEKTLLTYQWLVSKADDSGVFALLSGEPTLRGLSTVKPLTLDWKVELEQRFRSIILSNLVSNKTDAWRKLHGVSIDSAKIITLLNPYTNKDNLCDRIDLNKQITNVLSRKGELKCSHNEYHPEAKTVTRVELNLYPLLEALVRYGYECRISGQWRIEPTCVQRSETIPEFFNRTVEYIDDLMVP